MVLLNFGSSWGADVDGIESSGVLTIEGDSKGVSPRKSPATKAKDATEQRPKSTDKTKRPAKDKPENDKRKKKEAADKDNDEDRLAPGVRLWPELSAEDQKKIIAEHKDHLKSIQEMFPQLRFNFIETDYFLLFSDLSPADLRSYAPYLDAMYKRLLTLFEVKAKTNIWRGKALIIIFAHNEAYLAYEKQKQNHVPPDGVAGLCHCMGNGDVITSMRVTELNRKQLAAVIVHETTHGFVWRYKTQARIPGWVNEGLAEHVANLIVPGFRARDEQLAIRGLQQFGQIPAGFFQAPGSAVQYGLAYNLTKYMISANPKKYKTFFVNLKNGMTEEESLQDVYGIRRDVLVTQYGRAIGIPNLRLDPRDAPAAVAKP
ncbi:MAG: hypothetical protein K8T91_26090 [Planctomycetes bacterium]|nr:hypothetical protein [Planctomycetota bacterium]